MPGIDPPPTLDDVRDAARRLAGIAVRTPLLEAPALNERIGGRLLVKAEALQRTGSFKFRGAYNCISRLGPEARRAGVVAFSSGNHAQGVAAAASLLDAPAVIVMPDDAPAVKREGTARWGAEIVGYDRHDHDARDRIAQAIVEARGGTLVRPFDDPFIMAGQGTAGLELCEQASDMGLSINTVLVPCGGGGLASGVATVVKGLSPGTDVYTVEPEGFDDTARSLAAGSRQRNAGDASSFCDALLSPQPGELTFAVMERLVAGGLSVRDEDAAQAMRDAFTHLKLVLEPGGAVALAAALSAKLDCRGRTVVAVCSGGNVDPATFARAITEGG